MIFRGPGLIGMSKIQLLTIFKLQLMRARILFKVFMRLSRLKSGRSNLILSDICAFLNTNGGAIFVGVTPGRHLDPPGVNNPAQIINSLTKEIDDRISPPIKLTIDIQKFRNKDIIRILIPRGEDSPYAVDENQIYIRDESETNLAVRDEIVTLVESHNANRVFKIEELPSNIGTNQVPVETKETFDFSESIDPKTGVEITESIVRGGKTFYTMRDLRNGNTVKNVTQASARRLWHYAISKYDSISNNPQSKDIKWKGNYGLLSRYKQGQNDHFDFILRKADDYRFFFGVTLDGIEGEWRQFLEIEEN